MDKWKDDEPKSASQGTSSPNSQHHLDFDDDDDDEMDLDLANDSDMDSSDHNHHNRSHDSDLLWQQFGENFGDHDSSNKFTHNILSTASNADDLNDHDLYHTASVSAKHGYDSFNDFGGGGGGGSTDHHHANNSGGDHVGSHTTSNNAKKLRDSFQEQLIHQNGFEISDEMPRCSRSSNDTNNNSLNNRRTDQSLSGNDDGIRLGNSYQRFDDSNHLFYQSNSNTIVCQSEV